MSRYTVRQDMIRQCKKSASSYISQKKFYDESLRRRDSMREMIFCMEGQLAVLKSAESALSEQLEKLSPDMEKITEERKKIYGRKNQGNSSTGG